MLNREDWMYISTERDKGVYIRGIAGELGVHPKTVSRALKRGGPPLGKRPGGRVFFGDNRTSYFPEKGTFKIPLDRVHLTAVPLALHSGK